MCLRAECLLMGLLHGLWRRCEYKRGISRDNEGLLDVLRTEWEKCGKRRCQFDKVADQYIYYYWHFDQITLDYQLEN